SGRASPAAAAQQNCLVIRNPLSRTMSAMVAAESTNSDVSAPDVTQLLVNWSAGDADAPAHLMPLVYEELRRRAREYLRRERSDHTLQPTALVHEAYLRMVDEKSVNWEGRAQFYGIAARVMRRILVDHARAHNTQKRGGGAPKLPLDEAHAFSCEETSDIVALDDALLDFARTYPRKSEVVEMKFFGGLETKEISEVLRVSEKTVLRDWNFAKLWLCRALSGTG
ncbi:MAG: sigma-70 family RNA polymerase sigma factor, partial [Chthoniobacterales bacterium]